MEDPKLLGLAAAAAAAAPTAMAEKSEKYEGFLLYDLGARSC